MARARQLGLLALGRTSPNPPVGAVIVDPTGVIVGEGHTQPAGHAHAEVVALGKAGHQARGATAVVTLEPCNHRGRTGPCVDALIAAGVARVVFAVADPTPVAGGGAARLLAAGIDVVAGYEAGPAAAGALRWWLESTSRHRPFVVWKFAASMDGRSAAADGTSRWISSAESRADAHQLRARIDAIMVGSSTVLADDSALTVRAPDGTPAPRQPLRVVLDRRHRVPATAKVLDGSAESLVLAEADPPAVLGALWARGIRSVLLEGGPTVAGAFLAARCVDEVVTYLAPTLLGAGPAALAGAGVNTISDAFRLEFRTVERLGPDVKLTAVPLW
jgi:diaminohydroxyphosphoribosylaminopyrimidine deaminase/5-amino-6-(5-phosphoribosylamino)uracil reductase